MWRYLRIGPSWALCCWLVVSAACDGPDRFAGEQTFLQAPLEEQHEKFAKLPPARQVQIYLAAQSREAPDTSYCREIAQTSGAAATPVIVAALQSEKEDYAKRDLLQALRCVSTLHPESCGADVLALARRVAQGIESDRSRRVAEGIVNDLRCSAVAP